jgi:hypothetical protein
VTRKLKTLTAPDAAVPPAPRPNPAPRKRRRPPAKSRPSGPRPAGWIA